jgi:hypothetical protein
MGRMPVVCTLVERVVELTAKRASAKKNPSAPKA